MSKETIALGGSPTCEDCRITPKLNVYQSGDRFYIGTYCNCGPYSRESEYYSTRKKAEIALKNGNFGR